MSSDCEKIVVRLLKLLEDGDATHFKELLESHCYYDTCKIHSLFEIYKDLIEKRAAEYSKLLKLESRDDMILYKSAMYNYARVIERDFLNCLTWSTWTKYKLGLK